MTIKKFFIVSLTFHFLLFTGLYFVPEPKTNKAREFVANLVSPEEAKKPAIQPPPILLPQPRMVPRVLPPPPSAKARRLPAPLLERSLPSPENPLIPGEGMMAHKPLKQNAQPSEGAGKDGTGRGHGQREGEETGVSGRSTLRPYEQPGYLSRKRIFDRDLIDEIARKDAGADKTDSRNPVTFDTKEYQFTGYMTKLRQKIESIWVYPPEAAEKGIYGDLKIRFTIKKDGRLGAVELVRTSGYKMLDDAAMKALKDGEPYWPLPDSWGRTSYTIEGHFVYLYGGYYLR